MTEIETEIHWRTVGGDGANQPEQDRAVLIQGLGGVIHLTPRYMKDGREPFAPGTMWVYADEVRGLLAELPVRPAPVPIPEPWSDDPAGLPETGWVHTAWSSQYSNPTEPITVEECRDWMADGDVLAWAPLPADPRESGWTPEGDR